MVTIPAKTVRRGSSPSGQSPFPLTSSQGQDSVFSGASLARSGEGARNLLGSLSLPPPPLSLFQPLRPLKIQGAEVRRLTCDLFVARHPIPRSPLPGAKVLRSRPDAGREGTRSAERFGALGNPEEPRRAPSRAFATCRTAMLLALGNSLTDLPEPASHAPALKSVSLLVDPSDPTRFSLPLWCAQFGACCCFFCFFFCGRE